ncbi:MAG: ABC transporter permease [Bryobacteraceae bacterium]
MSAAVFLEFGRIGFLNMLAFRLRYYTGVVTYFINVTVYYFIWRAVFDSSPGFAGFEFDQMITYVAVGWMIRSMYFNNIDNEMAADILEGKISMTMLKPVSLPMTYIARAIGESAFRLLLLTTPTALVLAAVFPVLPPASAAHFGAFAVSLAGSVLLVAAINFIVGCFAVSMKSILGLLRAKFWMQELLSGLLVPVTLFPGPLRELSGMLPFQQIGFTPMMIYLGKYTWAETARALAIEGSWIVFLLWFGAWFWRFMSRKITIHGG